MQDASQLGRLVLVQDMSFVERRNTDTKRFIFAFLAVLAVLISLMTVFVAHLSWRGWLSAVKDILRGELLSNNTAAAATAAPAAAPAPPPEMQPLIGDLRELLQESPERQGDNGWSSDWTPDKLRALLEADLAGDQVLVVSNREPYIHTGRMPGSPCSARPAAW
jgi:trehalose 6-phosphate synthase